MYNLLQGLTGIAVAMVITLKVFLRIHGVGRIEVKCQYCTYSRNTLQCWPNVATSQMPRQNSQAR